MRSHGEANPTSNKKLNLSHSQLISMGSIRNDRSVIGGYKLCVLHMGLIKGDLSLCQCEWETCSTHWMQ